ncbi:MAG: hypothetical protein K0Q55_2952 [Verrucomicrobia bacterium]|jgi:hypothetical protein|nr:hypothetical protein [Verrucomicrobiota bacterium]
MTTLKSLKLSSLVSTLAVAIGSLLCVSTAQAGLDEMTVAANNWLASLTPEQKAKALYELKHEERLNWHFIPKDRKGLPLKEMTQAQRHLAHALFASGMSQRGQAQALSIMSLEQILHDMENKSPRRDPEMYHFTIFGTPAADKVWGWRVEGHHFSQNFTVGKDTEASGTPSFMGTNPGEVREGQRKGIRVMGVEEDLGRKLVTSLNDTLRKQAIFTDVALKDIVTMADKKVKPLDAVGVRYEQLSKDQQADLIKLIKLYVERVRPEIANQEMAQIEKAGLNGILFAWAGSLKRDEGHYYRVQGPTFLIEYDNTQNNANHVHAVWRDFNGDFGEDILSKHYAQEHKK